MQIVNRRAYFDYDILEEFEAGIVLSGAETKSLKKGAASLAGSRVLVKDGAFWVVGMQINPYEFAASIDYDPLRSRKLLLNKQELLRLQAKLATKGLTIVPLECYNKGTWIKLKVALVRGKKQYEKREKEKKRDIEREIQTEIKKREQRRTVLD